MNKITHTRNASIDVLKAICAYLVVFLHCNWRYSDLVLPLTRCAVPCFFMISGYLLFKDADKTNERIKRSINHVLKITTWATIGYFVWNQFVFYYKNNSICPISLNQFLKWLLFNDCPYGFHLWYLYAYLYVLFIVNFLNKSRKFWLLYFFVFPLLLIDVVFGKYGLLFFNIDTPIFLLRNFLFVGLPYFSIGVLLTKVGNLYNKRKLALGGGILFSASSYFERYMLEIHNAVSTREHYLSTTLLSLCLFVFIVSSSTNQYNFLAKTGHNDSLYIYILHPILLIVCKKNYRTALFI